MVYFAKGELPWQGLKAPNSTEKDRLVMERKIALSVEALCEGLPQEFAQYMKYVKSLKHGARPDYALLRNLFHGVAQKYGIEYDNVFDWTLRMYLQEEQNKRTR